MFITIGEIIEYNQPDIFLRLSKLIKPVKREKKVEISFEEAEKLMRHDSYKRIRGAIRQKNR